MTQAQFQQRAGRAVMVAMQRAVRKQVRNAIVQGIRDCAKDIYDDSQRNVPVGSRQEEGRGYWKSPSKRPRGKNPQTTLEWSFKTYKSGTLKRSGKFRRSASGATIEYNAAYGARREFGIGDHTEQVPEYMRRVRAARRPRKGKPIRGRVIALQSVSGYYRFVRREPGNYFLSRAVNLHLPNLAYYIQRALNRAANTMP